MEIYLQFGLEWKTAPCQTDRGRFLKSFRQLIPTESNESSIFFLWK